MNIFIPKILEIISTPTKKKWMHSLLKKIGGCILHNKVGANIYDK